MNRSNALSLRTAAAGLLVAAASLVAAPAARADLRFPPSPRELHHEVHALVHDVLRALDRIPVEIRFEHRGDLEVFFVGNVYDRGHRHYHATYEFPVWIDEEVEYRPYVYCNDHLYGVHSVRPRFWYGWGVESQGRWCGHHRARYPSSHACFRGHRADRRYDHYEPHPRTYPGWQGSVHPRGVSERYRSDRDRYDGYRHPSGRHDAYRHDGRRHSGHRDESRHDGGKGHRHDRNCHHDRDDDRRHR